MIEIINRHCGRRDSVTSSTWGGVHVGDRVLDADQRPWLVVGRDTEREWRRMGREARFTLELHGNRAEAWRMLDRPVEMAERADHSDSARVAQMFIDSGMRLEVLEERAVTTVEPQAAVAPTAQVKRDKYGRYLLPDPDTGEERAWTRATTIARVLADEYNLGQWAERMVAKGMALRPDLVAGAAAADPKTDKKTLQSIAQQAKDAAGAKSGANLGTALHSFTERLDKGEALESLGAPLPLKDDIRAYQRLMKRAKLTVLSDFIERRVIVPSLGVAGTIDRVVKMPDSTLRILDLKTGKDLSYGWLEIAIQQAIYANATHAFDATTEALEPMPENIDKGIGYILHLPVGKANAVLYEIDLDGGWRLAQVAAKVKTARGQAKHLARVVEIPEADNDVFKQITHAADQQTLAALWETYHPRGLWTDEVHAYAQARLRQLTQA